jgi:hypothetical protein
MPNLRTLNAHNIDIIRNFKYKMCELGFEVYYGQGQNLSVKIGSKHIFSIT